MKRKDWVIVILIIVCVCASMSTAAYMDWRANRVLHAELMPGVVEVTWTAKDTGNPLLGAAVGRSIAGNAGGLVGMILGGGEEKTCGAIISVDGTHVTFSRYAGETAGAKELLCRLQKGDEVTVGKNFQGDGSIRYIWKGEEGKIIPR